MQAGRMPVQFDIRWPWMAECPCSHGRREGTLSQGRRGTSLFPVLLCERGLKPSLATTHAKASEGVIAYPVVRNAGQGSQYALRYECWFKAKFGYDDRRGFSPCDRRPSGQERGTRERFVCHQLAPTVRRTVYMKCAVSQNPRHKHAYSTTYKARLNGPRSTVHAPSPGRSVTLARRLYVSSLANFRVSDPRYGVANTDVSYRHCAKDGAFGGHLALSLRAYTVSLPAS